MLQPHRQANQQHPLSHLEAMRASGETEDRALATATRTHGKDLGSLIRRGTSHVPAACFDSTSNAKPVLKLMTLNGNGHKNKAKGNTKPTDPPWQRIILETPITCL